MKERGAALLEFAMALPFALILFIGIGDFSAYFWRQTQMEEAARLTVSKIAPAVASYISADAAALRRLSQALQEDVRKESGIGTMSIALTRHYACPLADGTEQDLHSEPKQCPSERVYLRISNDDAVAPLLGPLRAVGFPKNTFSRHVLRVK